MHYIATDKQDLEILMKGLEVLDHVNPEIAGQLDVYLFGVTQDTYLLAAAKEAISSDSEEDWDEDGKSLLQDEDIQISEIGVSVKVSSTNARALLGSGTTPELDFAYQTDDGEKRSGMFSPDQLIHAKVTVDSLSTYALADSDSDLSEFFAKAATTPAHINHKVRRDSAPAAHTEEAVSQAWNVATPHRAGLKPLKEILEDFLG